MDEFLGSNRELWDEWTEAHESSEFYDLRPFRDGAKARLAIDVRVPSFPAPIARPVVPRGGRRSRGS